MENRNHGPVSESGKYQLGEFTFDVDSLELRRGEEIISLPYRSRLLLKTFVEHPRKVLTHKLLMEKLWGEGVNTEKDSLTQCVSKLRKGLGNKGYVYIETVPNEGFQFIGPVKALNEVSAGEPNHFTESPLYRDIFERINQIPALLPEGTGALAWVIGNVFVTWWEKEVQKLVSPEEDQKEVPQGIILPRDAVMGCNYALLEIAKKVTVIEPRCMDHLKEWSSYWREEWVAKLGARTDLTERKYYVLIEPPLTARDVVRLLATFEFLKSHQFTLYLCDKPVMQDYFGTVFPVFDSINIFGQFAVHNDIIAEEVEERTFIGGHPLRVWLHVLKKGSLYFKIYERFKDQSKPATTDYIKSLQANNQ